MRAWPLVFVSALLALAGCGDGDTTVNQSGGTGLTISGVGPSAGPVAGGTVIAITGSGYVDGATVTVGGNAATNVTFVSSVALTAETPAGTLGSAHVVVTNPDGTAVALADAFTYAPPPIVTAVTPTLLDSTGNTSITIDGMGFSTGAEVTVGGNPAVVVSRTTSSIVALAPAGTSGVTSVDVTNDDGQVASIGATYDDPPIIATVNAPRTVQVGAFVSFDVTATDPEGMDVGLALMNPPTGGTMAPIAPTAGPVTATLAWHVHPSTIGLQSLLFRSTDAAGNVAFLTVSIEVVGARNAQGVRIADVTGDGVLDVLASARTANTPVAGAGLILLWEGRTTMSGTPTAVLRVAAALPGDQLTYVPAGYDGAPGWHLCDVTGDGILDVVAAAPLADVGNNDTGAIYVWAGGAGLVGSVDATASLQVPGAAAGTRLGFTGGGVSVLCCDVTGDGTNDVIAGASYATAAAPQSGAVYVWAGGSGLSGTQAPTASLSVSGAVTNDRLADAIGAQALLCCDVSGDATLDIVALAIYADTTVSDAGAVYVWEGGSGLTGAVSHTARLLDDAPNTSDLLGYVGGAQGLHCCDVTGDGRPDVVVGAVGADKGASGTGAVYVFAGGALAGDVNPTALLVQPTPSTNDQLCYAAAVPGLHCCEVTGDNTLDIVAIAALRDLGVADAGGVYVWAGGAALTGTPAPTASLEVPGAAPGDRLGWKPSPGGTTLLCCDVVGDDTPDLIVSTPQALVAGQGQAGAVYVWTGGSVLTGTLAPTATLTRPGAANVDRLTDVEGGTGLFCCDLNGDLKADILACSMYADTTVQDAGEILVWNGGAGLAGTPAPDATLRPAVQNTSDLLGFTWNEGGIHCCDVTGDGLPDVIATAPRADTVGSDTGATYVWRNGGSGFSGLLNEDAILTAPGVANGDLVGHLADYGTGGRSVLCCDATGDGILDIIVGTRYLDHTATGDAGAVLVWAGGAGLTGAPAPTATVQRAEPRTSDYIGDIRGGQGILCSDVTGDGVPDLVIGAWVADVGVHGDAGAVFVAVGGMELSGVVFPTLLTRTERSGGETLGR